MSSKNIEVLTPSVCELSLLYYAILTTQYLRKPVCEDGKLILECGFRVHPPSVGPTLLSWWCGGVRVVEQSNLPSNQKWIENAGVHNIPKHMPPAEQNLPPKSKSHLLEVRPLLSTQQAFNTRALGNFSNLNFSTPVPPCDPIWDGIILGYQVKMRLLWREKKVEGRLERDRWREMFITKNQNVRINTGL